MLGFGTKNNTSIEILENAVKSGYKFIDFKDTNYSISHLNNINFKRDDIILCSKLVGEKDYENHNPKKIKKVFFKNLEKCGLTYWDIYYIHTFHSFGDYNILDTYSVLLNLKLKGYIRNIGVSNITFEQLESLCINSTKPDYIQIEIHPYLIEEQLVKFCKSNNINIVAHSPFGSKIRKKIINETILINLSNKYKVSIYKIILQWHIQRNIIPIPSSNNIKNIKENKKKNNFLLTEFEINQINSLNKNKRVYCKPNHYQYFKKCCSLPIRKIIYEESDIHEIKKLNLNGYCIDNTNVDVELNDICNKIYDNINNKNIKKRSHFSRSYDFQLEGKELDILTKKLSMNKYLVNLAYNYLETTNFEKRIFIKRTFRSLNLSSSKASYFHRDSQKQKCLKIIIYLDQVNEMNGALKIVDKELSTELNNNILWFKDGIPRTSEDELKQIGYDKYIKTLVGRRNQMILFDGSILHSGGYVKKGYRNSVYIEFFKKREYPYKKIFYLFFIGFIFYLLYSNSIIILLGIFFIFIIVCLYELYSIFYIKPNRAYFYIYNNMVNIIPDFIYKKFNKYNITKDYIPDEYIKERVNYYNKLDKKFSLINKKVTKYDFSNYVICDKISNIMNVTKLYSNRNFSSYTLDFKKIFCYYNKHNLISILFGDGSKICNNPTLIKARDIKDNNRNNIILKFDKITHFNFVKYDKRYETKINKIIWRGSLSTCLKIEGINYEKNILRTNLINNIKSNEYIDIDRNFKSIRQQLEYKFILSIEGNDVATNLKWIMSSNSLCFMPKPTRETWFMEGKLIPNYHYVIIKDDFSDLENKIKYYIKNEEEAKNIINNAHTWVDQFRDEKREKLIEKLVLDKYIKLSSIPKMKIAINI